MLCSISLEIRSVEQLLPFLSFLIDLDSSGCVMGLLRMSKSGGES